MLTFKTYNTALSMSLMCILCGKMSSSCALCTACRQGTSLLPMPVFTHGSGDYLYDVLGLKSMSIKEIMHFYPFIDEESLKNAFEQYFKLNTGAPLTCECITKEWVDEKRAMHKLPDDVMLRVNIEKAEESSTEVDSLVRLLFD